MAGRVEDAAKEVGYVLAHGLIAVAALVVFKVLAAGMAGERFPGLRGVAATA